MKKGQFSIEFVVVLALLLTVFATISVPLYRNSRDTAEQTKVTMRAREAANQLASTIDSVYSGGTGTGQQARYWLPAEVTKIEGNPTGNKLLVELKLDLGKIETVRVDTLLPAGWNDRIELNKIETTDYRSYHETRVSLTENEGSSEEGFIITLSDKIISGE